MCSVAGCNWPQHFKTSGESSAKKTDKNPIRVASYQVGHSSTISAQSTEIFHPHPRSTSTSCTLTELPRPFQKIIEWATNSYYLAGACWCVTMGLQTVSFSSGRFCCQLCEYFLPSALSNHSPAFIPGSLGRSYWLPFHMKLWYFHCCDTVTPSANGHPGPTC